MASRNPRIKAPKQAKKGEIIEIKTVIPYKMKTGLRKGKVGRVAPRMIIHEFKCTLNENLVFKADLHEGIASDPFFQFFMIATESGLLEFSWKDDNQQRYVAKRELIVT